mmetsp:Transcript_9044/g.18778  ORF Transcript_9044/g.18778 Transcript_9044/m.18778 type:complete len:250 (-) Transcript_9044:71-820(-)
MNGIEATCLVVTSKNYHLLRSNGGCRMIGSRFRGSSNDVRCRPNPSGDIKNANSVEPLGTANSTEKDQFVGRWEKCRRVATATSGNISRSGRRIPKHDFGIEDAECVAGDDLVFLRSLFPAFDRINGFTTKGDDLLTTGNKGCAVPLPSFTTAVDGLVPGSTVLWIVYMHIRQNDRISLKIEGLTAIHQYLAIVDWGHAVSPAGRRCGIRKCALGTICNLWIVFSEDDAVVVSLFLFVSSGSVAVDFHP